MNKKNTETTMWEWHFMYSKSFLQFMILLINKSRVTFVSYRDASYLIEAAGNLTICKLVAVGLQSMVYGIGLDLFPKADTNKRDEHK